MEIDLNKHYRETLYQLLLQISICDIFNEVAKKRGITISQVAEKSGVSKLPEFMKLECDLNIKQLTI